MVSVIYFKMVWPERKDKTLTYGVNIFLFFPVLDNFHSKNHFFNVLEKIT